MNILHELLQLNAKDTFFFLLPYIATSLGSILIPVIILGIKLKNNKKEKAELADQIRLLQKRGGELNSTIHNLQNKNAELTNTIKEWEELFRRLQNEKDKLIEEKNELFDTNRKLDEQLEALSHSKAAKVLQLKKRLNKRNKK